MTEQEKRNLIVEKVHSLYDKGAIDDARRQRLLDALPRTDDRYLDASLQAIQQLCEMQVDVLRKHIEDLDTARRMMHEAIDRLECSDEAKKLAHETTNYQSSAEVIQQVLTALADPTERAAFAQDLDEMVKLPTWALKLHPTGYPMMSEVMAALVGWLLQLDICDPPVAGIRIVEDDEGDRFQMLGEGGEVGFEAGVDELRENFQGLFRVAGLSAEERLLAEFAFHERMGIPLEELDQTRLN